MALVLIRTESDKIHAQRNNDRLDECTVPGSGREADHRERVGHTLTVKDEEKVGKVRPSDAMRSAAPFSTPPCS